MDAGLLWTAVGSAAGVLAAGLVGWQVRLQVRERHELRSSSDSRALPVSGGGLPVAVPVGRLPAEVRGRDAVLVELRRVLARKPRRSGGTWVLAGMGGLGKSTVALAVALEARSRGWRVWWVTATDTASLAGGMLEVLYELGAPESVTRPVREGGAVAAQRAWSFLDGRHLAGRRWLLVFDNADSPVVLAAQGAASPADYAGWLRPSPSGVVVVTTRAGDRRVWGAQVMVRELQPLDDATAGQVLADLAPDVPDPGGVQARDLGHRLGGLPLALHLAGTCLASPFALYHSFADYRRALDGTGFPGALADLDDYADHARRTIARTWELSLDALAADGRPQARPLLSLLSCYAAATLIPAGLLRPEPLAGLIASGGVPPGDTAGNWRTGPERWLRDGLSGLAAVGLIGTAGSTAGSPAVTVHAVVSDANRSRLLTTARSDLPLIGQAAVAALDARTGELSDQVPADWLAWHQLTPHVIALLQWLAVHLGTGSLVRLLAVSDRAYKAMRRSGNLAAAQDLAALSVTAAVPLGGDHPASLTARHALGRAIAAQGRNGEAEQMFRDVLADEQRILGPAHRATLATRYHLAWSIEYQGRYGEAEQLYRDLLADQQRSLGSDDPDTLTTHQRLAWLIALRGGHQDAEHRYRQVVADRRRVLGADHPDTLQARYGLASAIGLQGRYQESERQLRELLADQQRILGEEHPDNADTRYRLARAITDQGRYSEAEELYRQVLADRQRVHGDHHPATLAARDNLARAVGLRGRYREAEHMLRQVLADRQHMIGDEHPQTLTTRYRLARVIAGQGRHGEAEEMLRRVLADRERVLGGQHPSTLTTRYRLARIIADQGRHGEPEEMLRRVLADRERVLGTEHPDTEQARNQLTRITGPPRNTTS